MPVAIFSKSLINSHLRFFNFNYHMLCHYHMLRDCHMLYKYAFTFPMMFCGQIHCCCIFLAPLLPPPPLITNIAYSASMAGLQYFK